MANNDSNDYLKWLDSEISKEAQGIQNDARFNDEEKAIRLDTLNNVKHQLAFENGFDNSDY
ncbi:hypothetical protein V7201_10750 [Bacillus sp. JJ1122]|uniref:hypothetical protein n=1 Tax=Bacillus sp. JJ1122 TaxID=3122951 RepID=UPI002FFE5E09